MFFFVKIPTGYFIVYRENRTCLGDNVMDSLLGLYSGVIKYSPHTRRPSRRYQMSYQSRNLP